MIRGKYAKKWNNSVSKQHNVFCMKRKSSTEGIHHLRTTIPRWKDGFIQSGIFRIINMSNGKNLWTGNGSVLREKPHESHGQQYNHTQRKMLSRKIDRNNTYTLTKHTDIILHECSTSDKKMFAQGENIFYHQIPLMRLMRPFHNSPTKTIFIFLQFCHRSGRPMRTSEFSGGWGLKKPKMKSERRRNLSKNI